MLTPDETTGVIESNHVLAGTTVYPNPTTNSVTITLSLTRSARVNFELTDMYGREVKPMMHQQLDAGSNNLQLDVGGLARGYYFLSITSGQQMVTKKLILVN